MADYSPSYPVAEELERTGTPSETFDDRLVEGLRIGSEEAYEALIQRFQHPAYNLICRLVDDENEAADVLQEVFLKVFRKIDSFRGQSSLKTWIYRIAVNEAYNQRRFFARHRRQEVRLDRQDEEGIAFQEILPDHSESPFDLVANLEMQGLIREALKDLNEGFRTAVILRDLEGMSYEEIADVLQVNLGTVKSRILRGREALRKRLATRLEPGRGESALPELTLIGKGAA